MSLYLKYRPETLEDMEGNEDLIKSLSSVLERKEGIPHAILFTGPSGNGKTTLARIVRKVLKCGDYDYYECNTADFNGVDTIREIRKKMQYKPTAGESRVWLIDECFPGNTKVNTSEGYKEIKDIKENDIVYNIQEKTKVERVFKNKVLLNKVIKLKLSNGKEIITTEDHLFLTDSGWIKAKNLNKNIILSSIPSYIMINTSYLSNKGVEDETRKDLSNMQSKVYCKKKGKCNLRKDMWEQISRDKKKGSFGIRRDEGDIKSKTKTMVQNEGRESSCQKEFREYEEKQSYEQFTNLCQNDGDQKSKWNSTCLEREERGKWTVNRTSDNTCLCSGMGNRGGSLNQNERGRISHMLQNGHSKQGTEISNRGGWEGISIEKSYIDRCEKDRQSQRVWVESIEIYKSGNNDESFQGAITDLCRSRGYTEFYDLQIENHPSYFIEDIPVHNCHMLTKQAQEAILKLLEDTPEHVYFILATTNPSKLIKTIKTRCSTFEVQELSPRRMQRLLEKVIKAEGASVPDEVVKQISQDCMGSCRSALVILDSIIDMDEDNMLKAASRKATEENDVKELCQILLKGSSWKEVGTILKGITAEPETVRRQILGYMNTVLLNSGKERASDIIEEFLGNFFDSGKAGLTQACFRLN